jgi:mannosylglycerate hydrolase
VGSISRERLTTRPWPAGPQTPTPNAQMIGKTEFALSVWPNASPDALFRTWERFALPIADAPARGGGTLPSSGSLLRVEGDVELSSVRRRDGEIEVCVWNPRQDRSADVVIEDRRLELGRAKIARVRLDR